MKHILWICWVIIALPFQTFAQEEENLTLNDTLVIKMNNQCQARIIGESMLSIIAYTRADSLKNIFLNDLARAINQSGSRQLPLKVYYLVHPSGKRRMKVKAEEYTDETFDLGKEVYRLNEDLPKHELNVYDLKTGIVMQFYINDSNGLQDMADLNMMAAINFALANKKEVKRTYRYDITQQLGDFAEVKKYRTHYETIEISPVIGTTLMGSMLTPVIGAELSFHFRNKYNQEILKAGVKMSGYFFTDFSGGKFNKVYSNTGYDLFFLFSADPKSKNSFSYGLEGGFIAKSPKSDGVFNGNPAHFGFLLEYKGFQYSFGFIKYNSKESIPMVGVKLPF